MKKKLLASVIVLLVVCGAGSWCAGSRLVAPSNRSIGSPPEDLSLEAVSFGGSPGRPVSGWILPPSDDRPVIVLMHGIGSDRTSMVGRARFLKRAGYGCLLFDFQAHGETQGSYKTAGYLESFNAKDAVSYVRIRYPKSKVGAIGMSLGGAAALLGAGPIEVDALVLEEVYSTIDRAVTNRVSLRVGPVGPILAKLLLWQISPRLGISTEELRPIERIALARYPVLIVGGTHDRRSTQAETAAFYERANEPKELWLVEGAGHGDFHWHDRAGYEARILKFFSDRL